jgi:hypothetical protein
MAGNCPYCRSPVVVGQQLVGDFAPDLVIPFRYTRDQAVEALRKLYEGKRLLPKVFSQQNFVDEVKGVYVPFWLFDFETQVSEHYTAVTRTSRTAGNRKYITTSTYAAVRGGTASFKGIPVDGSVNMPDAIMESIEPFDLTQAQAFHSAYLSGFLAERYDLDKTAAENRARERLTQTGGEVFKDTVTGYDSVTANQAQVDVTSYRISYGLLPVWMLTTIWNGQRFTFAMNGQTGRLVGDLPLDRRAYRRWLMLLGSVSAVAAGVVAAVVTAL